MSLRRDFNMYYEGSYVTLVKPNGDRVPFYVYGIDNDSSRVEELRFSGKLIKQRGSEEINGVPWTCLDFTLPPLGYVQVGDRKVWISYMSRKTVKKGFHSQRVSLNDRSGISFNDSLARAVWYNDNVTDFAVKRSTVEYKGRVVGEVRNGNIDLLASARFLGERAAAALSLPLATGA